MSFARNLTTKIEKKLLDTAAKIGLDALKTDSKKFVHKAAKATGKFIGNKIAAKFVKPKPVIEEYFRNIEEIVIPPEERNIKQIKTSIIKWITIEYQS